MNEQWIKLHSFIESRSQRDRIIMLACVLIALYLLFESIWIRPFHDEADVLISQLQPAQETIERLEARANKIIEDSTLPPAEAAIKERDALKQRLSLLNQEFSTYSQKIISPSQMIDVLKKLLEQQHLTLNSLENKPVIMNLEKKTDESPPVETAPPPQLYAHSFILIFQGDFFSTLAYLQQLEKLPWRIYWDNMEYQVERYPRAKVTLTIHIFGTKENLIDV